MILKFWYWKTWFCIMFQNSTVISFVVTFATDSCVEDIKEFLILGKLILLLCDDGLFFKLGGNGGGTNIIWNNFHSNGLLASSRSRCEFPFVRRSASRRTVVIHSFLGRLTLLIYLLAAVCRAPGTEETPFMTSSSGARSILPKSWRCKFEGFL